jgi:hypothetical protein
MKNFQQHKTDSWQSGGQLAGTPVKGNDRLSAIPLTRWRGGVAITALVLFTQSAIAQMGSTVHSPQSTVIHYSNISFNSPLFYRFKALAMVESGNCDVVRGEAGEVSRFGIMPSVWHQYTKLPLSAAKNPFTALRVTMDIMRDRCAAFENKFHRPCTDAEFYLLWHRPAYALRATSRQARLPAKVSDRMMRFENLCRKFNR